MTATKHALIKGTHDQGVERFHAYQIPTALEQDQFVDYEQDMGRSS